MEVRSPWHSSGGFKGDSSFLYLFKLLKATCIRCLMASSFTLKASNVVSSSLGLSLSLWPLFHHLFLILWPSCLCLIRILFIALGLQDNPGKSLHLKSLHLITFAMSFFTCKMIYSQVSGIGTWTSLGDHYSITFPECVGAIASGLFRA